VNRFAIWLFAALPPACFAAVNVDSHLLLQKPTVSRTQIVFVHAGDLWSVPREGGDARRLTVGSGAQDNPIFSPDGSRIAFTGEYDGNVDVFVMPAEGGVPKRLTWHPAPDIVLGWTPDGKRILFSSNRTAFSRFDELFTVDLDGHLPQKVDLPMGFEGAYSRDGSQLAYVPLSRAFTFWKRYRGGRTTPIWIATLASGQIVKIPRDNSNDFNPMWIGDKVYFLSDRNGAVSLFSYDVKTKEVKGLIENHGLDLKSAGAGPDAIVYEQFGALHLYDLKTGKSKPVPVRLSADLAEVRPRFIDVSKRLRSPHISPTGARAVFEARGEIITVPAEKGDPRNLTQSPGVMDRDPVWSPDGKTVAYFSDEAGEYELHIRAQNGVGDVKKIKLGEKPGFYFTPRWSPDGQKIAYVDSHQTIWYIDLEQRKPVRIDKDIYWVFGGSGELTPVWSPDSKWIAYARRLKNFMNAIYFYSIADNKSTLVTDGMSDVRYPAFDKDGKFLYFTASTDSGPSLQPDIDSITRPVSRSLYVLVLSKKESSPLAPESDDEKDDKKPDEKKTGDAARTGEGEKKPEPAKPGATPKAVAVNIDFDNISQRILALPLPARRYVSLQTGKAGVLYAVEAPGFTPGGFGGGPRPALTVHRFDLKTRKSDVAIGGVSAFEISLNGEKMLYRQADKWYIAAPKPMATGATPPPLAPPAAPAAGALKTEGLEIKIEPTAAWRQMYLEAWRIERDFFYDPGYHGLDLEATSRFYQPYLEHISSRRDLNYLFSEMLGELTVGHLGASGGDMPEVKRIQTGLLGADYKLENGRYRFARVYNGENWNPQLKAPLTQPGVNVVAGEYLLAVNGRDLRETDNIYAFFEGAAGKSVALKVGSDSSGAGAREVIVTPVDSETGLRNLAWIEDNRRKVDQMTNGRVAYIYMPDTAFGGHINFNRYFFAQIDKEAAIIDERFNGGGALATDIVEYLKRPLLSYVATRDGEDEPEPQGAIFGPKVMIINEFAGSGGDAMPWYFKRAGVGKLIGKRTWGGLVGRALAPPLMDDGFVTAPSSHVWNPSGKYDIENQGMPPDIEVELDPLSVRRGHDPQLEKAVEVVLAELQKSPLPRPKRPVYPSYRRANGANGTGHE
jgi:tricorn protease